MRPLIAKLDELICASLNWAVFKLKGVDCRTEYSNIRGLVRVVGKGTIIIHPGVRINSGPRRNPIGGDTRVTLVCRKGGSIEIGSDAGLSNCALVCDTSISIGEGARIGGSVKIYDTDFHNIDPELRRAERAGSSHGASSPIVVGANSFIGAHSIILKGVTVGENSVVGAGSVVTKSIPSNEIWGGNPARHIRHLKKSTSVDSEK